MSQDQTAVPWVRWLALMAAMFGAPLVADMTLGWWAGWIVAAPAGAIAVRFL